MRTLLIVILFFFNSIIAKSQNLTVEGTAPDLYITHTVAPKENFYSISRTYNQPPKSIASFNNITMEKGLTIGQLVKIPLNAQNFDGSENINSGQGLIPLTHIVSKSETLFKIGSDLNVTAAALRKWNNLSSDKIAPGTQLIVGYLKTNNAQASASVVKNNTTPAANNEAPAQRNAAETEKQATTENKRNESSGSVSSGQVEESAQSKKESEVTSNSTAAAEKDTALAVIPEEPAGANNTTGTSVKEEPVKQPEPSSTKNEETKKTKQATGTVNSSAGTSGTFEDIYRLQASQKSENTKSGEAATFKSTSGWQDKKYYVLMNDVTAGTIVKISSSENKVIYAKVLGSMPEMKENNGLLLRISNAAASYLGIIDPKFPVQVSYYQ